MSADYDAYPQRFKSADANEAFNLMNPNPFATVTVQKFYRKAGFADVGPETTVEISGTPIRCYPMKMELS